MELRGSDILTMDQFDREDLRRIFDTAAEMEVYASRQKMTRVLEGAVLANLFFSSSTRSRISFGSAFNRLGGAVRDTTSIDESSIAKGESLEATARVVSGYSDAIVLRYPEEDAAKMVADASPLPVINGGDGSNEHPTQGLLDIFTILKERKMSLDDLDGLVVAVGGDLKYGRAAHSIVKGLSIFRNICYKLIATDELQMPDKIVELLRNRGHQVLQTSDLSEGIKDVDIVYMTRNQEDRMPRELATHLRGKIFLDRRTYERYARPDTTIMHPLPIDIRPGAQEIKPDLYDHPNFAVYRQTDNGMPVRMSIYVHLLGVVDRVHDTVRDAFWFRPDRTDSHR
ncbi:MAG: aspartate carbamoyltransferase [Candidatus Peribacteraceae bacterium]|nr:aspartate carbamoyltransferase [Candidatus Peribacteraceae bacterium]